MIYLRKDEATERSFRKRLTILMGIIAVLFGIILLRLGYLQILRGNYFQTYALQNSIQLIPIPAQRGMILDRNREPLVKDRISFSVGIIRGNLNETTLDKVCKNLANLLGLSRKKLKERLYKAKDHPFSPVIVARDIDIDKVTMIEENRSNLPGVLIQVEPYRTYLYGELASHILGYLGEIGPEELARLSDQGYQIKDIIGKSGLEKFHDRGLRGEKGGRQVEVNAKGERLRLLGLRPPKKGNDLVLTIDKDIQAKAEEAMAENCGAVVVMEVDSGRILALVSKPDFNPNLFLAPNKNPELERLLKDPFHPFLNRAIAALYPPGSLFKMIVTLAALEEGILDPKATVICPGYYPLGTHVFKCWKQEGHGPVSLIEAIAHSCNVYFYQLGLKVGAERLSHFARLFGLGEKSEIDLPTERKGFVPTPEWKKKQGVEWYPGDTVNLSIGQGFILTTPIQIAVFISAIANGGMIWRPYLVQEIQTVETGSTISFQPELRRRIHLSSRNLSLLRQGLEEVVSQGTGRAAYLLGLKIAGKTGTVQNPYGESHAWFAGFAPVDNPKVAIVVLVEHGGSGSNRAVPIARIILEEIFNKDLLQNKQTRDQSELYDHNELAVLIR